MFRLVVRFRPVLRVLVVVHSLLDFGFRDRDDTPEKVGEVLVFLAGGRLHGDMILPHCLRQTETRKEWADMESQNPANFDRTIDELEWVAELEKLHTKSVGEPISVDYQFPAGCLVAIVFQVEVHARKIHAYLQPQSPTDLASLYLELYLPKEDAAHYRIQRKNDETCLSVAYPYCDHFQLSGVPLAVVRFQTGGAALAFAETESLVQ